MKLLLGAVALAMLVGTGAFANAAPGCPNGIREREAFVPATGAGAGEAAGQCASSDTGAELPSVDGIPCTSQQLGTCSGLAESAS